MCKTVVSHIVSDVCRQLGGGGAVKSVSVNIRHVKSINKLVISLQQGEREQQEVNTTSYTGFHLEIVPRGGLNNQLHDSRGGRAPPFSVSC